MGKETRDVEKCLTQGGEDDGARSAAVDGPDALRQRVQELERALRASREQLQTAVEDLDNLLAGADVGALYLDPRLCVRRVTPVVSRVTRILPTDLGRPVHHLGFMDSCPHLAEDIQSVLDTLQPTEREVDGPEESAWLVRVRPYRTAAYAVEGVLVTLAESTRSRRLEQALRQLNQRLDQQTGQLDRQSALLGRLLEQTASLKLFVDGEKRLQYCNGAAKAWFAPREGSWRLPAELDDVFELMRYENHLRLCRGVPLEGGAGRRAVADVMAETSRDGEGRLLGVLYTMSVEGGA